MLTLPTLTSTDFLPLWPALILSAGACLVLLSEVFLSSASRSFQPLLTVIATVLGALVAAATVFSVPTGVFGGFVVLDPFGSLVSLVICIGVGLSALLAPAFLRGRQAERGEFYALLLFGGAGMSLLVLSNELIFLFINLEILSIATYALAAYLRRGPRPAEAGFKYFILGAFSSAVLLYGAALLFGATRSTLLPQMGAELARIFTDPTLSDRQPLAYCGLALIGAGFGFKIAAVPFHMWTPDVYEGAPTPVTAMMSAAVKAAAFAAMVRVFLVLGRGIPGDALLTGFSTLAFLTMIGGNLLALPQRNVKRMLAYSSISHAGYLLVGVASLFVKSGTTKGGVLGVTALAAGATPDTAGALRGILFYLLAYTVTTVGAFGVLGALERRDDEVRGFAWDLDRLAGLAQRKPAWAVAMAVFMLSLGGIPPMAGFMGKLLIFRSAVDAGLVGLVIVGVLTSAVGAYYYLRVVVYMYMRPAPEAGGLPERNLSTELALVLSTVAVVVLGVLPGITGTWLSRGGSVFLGR
ncbi:MAG: NADH-quinone oxidoreductase subunit N [Myxococcaceae bacterium]|nr:MAG: NADH-quinone oxidoreductase subunit N [Myxococcaceae bacterium]